MPATATAECVQLPRFDTTWRQDQSQAWVQIGPAGSMPDTQLWYYKRLELPSPVSKSTGFEQGNRVSTCIPQGAPARIVESIDGVVVQVLDGESIVELRQGEERIERLVDRKRLDRISRNFEGARIRLVSRDTGDELRITFEPVPEPESSVNYEELKRIREQLYAIAGQANSV